MSFLIFIPARSGSTRLKNKNFKIIKKKKLIEYTIDSAKRLGIKDIFISSDSSKVKKIIKKNKILKTYKRPNKVSKKNTSMADTVIHGVKWYKENINTNIKDIILLQPTFPMRNLSVLKKSIIHYKKKGLESVTSISKLKIDNSCLLFSKNLRKYYSNNFNGSAYKIDGNFYICSLKFLYKYKKFSVLNKTKFINFELNFKIDIDYKEDFMIVKKIIENANYR